MSRFVWAPEQIEFDVGKHGSKSDPNYGRYHGGELSTFSRDELVGEKGKVTLRKLEKEIKTWKGPRGDIAKGAVGTIRNTEFRFTGKFKRSHTLITLKDGGELVGVAAFNSRGREGETHLGYLATKRSGYGERMMLEAAKVAKANKQVLSVHSTQKSKGFYKQLGMKPFDKINMKQRHPNGLSIRWPKKEVSKFINKVNKGIADEPDDGVFSVPKEEAASLEKHGSKSDPNYSRYHGGGATSSLTTQVTSDIKAGKNPRINSSEVGPVLREMSLRKSHPDITELNIEGTLLFGDEGLGIARIDMPQIPVERRPEFLSEFGAEKLNVDPRNFQPIQKEISGQISGKIMKKFDKFGGVPNSERIIVTKDNFILDGHHTWSAAVGFAMEAETAGGKIPLLPVHRLPLESREAMRTAIAWNKAQGIKGQALGSPDVAKHGSKSDPNYGRYHGAGGAGGRFETMKKGAVNARSVSDSTYEGELKASELKEEVAGDLADRLKDNEAFQDLANDMITDSQDNDPNFILENNEDVTSELIRSWAHTSGDNDPTAIALQRAAVDEFNLDGAETDHFSIGFNEGQFDAGQNLYDIHGDGFRAFLRAQYDATQNELSRLQIDKLFLFRGGIRNDLPDGNSLANVGLQPLSSWSASYRQAEAFSIMGGKPSEGLNSYVLGSFFNPSEILSIPSTGLGCRMEDEFVTLGRGRDAFVSSGISVLFNDKGQGFTLNQQLETWSEIGN